MRTALTIAGSDSGGGAGIQADVRTFAAFGVHGTSAVTAITAQNTFEVSRVLPIPADIVAAQIDAVAADFVVDATKIGMLATAEIAAAVAAALRRHQLPAVVLDTVMVSTSGSLLLDDDGVTVLREELLPLARLTTANVPEAARLTGIAVRNVDEACRAAEKLVALGAQTALVKGGHLEGPAVDVFFDGRSCTVLSERRIDTVHTHGTGCTLSAAIAARLALGDTLLDAVRAGKRYVTRAIANAPGLGHGHGPLGLVEGTGALDTPPAMRPSKA